MAISTVGFIGLGLIGGSLAKMIRRVCPDMKIIGYNRSKGSLAAALADGTLNQAVNTIDDSFADCDIIFLCAPVNVNIKCMESLKNIVRPDCILTDVGSVKTAIHEAVAEMRLENQFIGGHPMAGSERFGYDAATDRLLENAYFILTTTQKTPAQMLEDYQELVSRIGSLPVVMDCREHDRVTAAISHLPHVVAYELVNLVKRSDSPEGTMKMLAAGGFRDITRIASSSPDMWQQICDENRDALCDMLHTYIESLQKMEKAIREQDAKLLWDEFEEARVYRNRIPQSRGKDDIPGIYEFAVDIDDQPGSMAVILSILSNYGVNIRNLGIINNREYQNGVFRILVDNKEMRDRGVEALRRRNYTVYVD